MRQVPGYQLWLGHVGDARDLRTVISTGILALVDLALNEPPATVTRELVYCRFPLLDGNGNPHWMVRAAVETVTGLLRSRTPTLLYCGAGMSRTPIIAAAAIARLTVCLETYCSGSNRRSIRWIMAAWIMASLVSGWYS